MWLRDNSGSEWVVLAAIQLCDFVVLDPASGLLFVEVKGGSLEFNPDRMEWRRVLPNGEGRLLSKDPFEQARRSMHEIVDRIGEELGSREQLPFTYGYAVAFPDCRYSGSLPASIVREQVLDAGKIADLRQSVERVFGRFRRGHAELLSREVQAVHEALYPRYELMPVVWRKVQDQEERLRRLTVEQQRLLDFLGSHTKAAIRGVAGSGKTILSAGEGAGDRPAWNAHALPMLQPPAEGLAPAGDPGVVW